MVKFCSYSGIKKLLFHFGAKILNKNKNNIIIVNINIQDEIKIMAFNILEEQNVTYVIWLQKMLCHFKKSKAVAQISKISILPPYDENKLKAAVALIGPISVSVNASPKTFQLYSWVQC